MIEITARAIDVQKVMDAARSDRCGAVAVFLGTVRNHSRNKTVTSLEYDAYPEMAEKMIARIAEEARQKWPVEKVAVAHRTGRLKIGEVAVAIAVSAPHRGAAFDACRYLIDRLKEVVPIWKKEIAEDGETWISDHA